MKQQDDPTDPTDPRPHSHRHPGRAPGTGHPAPPPAPKPHPGRHPGEGHPVSHDPVTTSPLPDIPPSAPRIYPRRVQPETQIHRTDTFVPVSTPLPIVYGSVKDLGALVVYDKVLSTGERLVVYKVCWGPINSISNIRIDGTAIGSLGTGYTQGTHYQIYTGTAAQALDATLHSLDANFVSGYPGQAYVWIKFHQPSKTNPAPNVRAFLCDVQGMLVRDPRQDATLVNRYYSDNPVLCTADYMTSARFGGNIADAAVDWSGSVTKAANDCDVLLSDGVTKRYTIGIRMDELRNFSDWIETLRSHAALNVIYNSGTWQMWVDQAQSASAVVFTDAGSGANIINAGPMKIFGSAEVPSRVRVNFVNSDAGNKDDFVLEEDPRITTIGMEMVEHTFDLKGLQHYDQARRIGRYLRKRGSIDKQVPLQVLQDGGLRVMPGLLVTVTSAQMNWANVQCVVTSISPRNGAWDITVEPYDASVYDDTIETTNAIFPPPNPNPNDPVPAPTGLTASEITYKDQTGVTQSRILLNWTSAFTAGYSLYDSTRIYYQRQGSGTLQYLGDFFEGPVEIQATLDVLQYTIYAYTVSTRGFLSPSASTTITTAGKTTNPSDVIAISATQNGDFVDLMIQPAASSADVIDYEYRRGVSGDTWATMIRVGTTKSIHLSDRPPHAGTWYYAVKAIDAAQRYSSNAASTAITVGSEGSGISERYSYFYPDTSQTHYGASSTDANLGTWLGTGNAIAEISPAPVGYGGYRQSIGLSRLLPPSTADNEITTNGYVDIATWESSLDAPRRGGAGIWAPLPANATGDLLGAGVGIPGSVQLGQDRARFLSVVQSGNDVPNSIAVAIPIWRFNIGGSETRTYGQSAFANGTVGTTGIGIRLSTNSTTYQEILQTSLVTDPFTGLAYYMFGVTGKILPYVANDNTGGVALTLGEVGVPFSLGMSSGKWSTLHAHDVHVGTLVPANTLATLGGRVLTGSRTMLALDVAAVDTTITVKDTAMAVGDTIYMATAPGGVAQIEFMAVTAGPTGSGPYSYTVTRNLSGAGAQAWSAGDAIFNTGHTGSGFIDQYSAQGLKSPSEVGPTIVGNVRNSSTYNDWSPRWAIGNLNGLYGYAVDTYGVAMGVPTGAWVKIDATNGVRIGFNTTTNVQIDAAGNASFSGSVTTTSGVIGGFTIGATALTAGSGSTTVGLDTSGTNPAFYAGSSTPGSAPFRVTNTGALTATNATLTGSITAGNVTVRSNGIDMGNATLAWNASTSSFSVTGGGIYCVNACTVGNLTAYGGSTGTAISCAGGNFSVTFTGNAQMQICNVTSLHINSVQVVGSRGASVAHATNSTDVITQLNALIDRMSAAAGGHGLIA